MKKITTKLILTLIFVTSIISPALAGPKEDAFKEIFNILQQNYVDKVDSEKLYEGAINGMLGTLNDPYTVYFDTYGYKSFMQDFESNFSGIGVQIKEDKQGMAVVSVLKDSPAMKAGLKIGDIITAADGKTFIHQNAAYAAQLIRGKEGSKVTVTVKRGTKTFNVTMKRATIDNSSVDYKLLGKHGYLKINEFKEDTAAKTAKALDYFASKKATALILDLRDNPGGELNAALSICEMLLPSGPLIQIVSGEGEKHAILGEGKGYGKPIVVLINGGSASASEVVSGALQDRKAAILVGEKSFGKASVQSVYPLESGGGLKFTVAHYLTPNGRYIHGKGIDPDLFVFSKDAKTDLVLAKAEEILKNKDYLHQTIHVDAKNLVITVNGAKVGVSAARLSGRYLLPLKVIAQSLGMDYKNNGQTFSIKAKQKTLVLKKQEIRFINNEAYIPLAKFLKTWNIRPTINGSGIKFNF